MQRALRQANPPSARPPPSPMHTHAPKPLPPTSMDMSTGTMAFVFGAGNRLKAGEGGATPPPP